MGNITIQGDLTGGVPGGEVGGGNNLTTVGAIPYVSSAGVLNQDATKLFWDATNKRLGVGTASPGYSLHVVTSGQTYGYLGLGNGGGGIIDSHAGGALFFRVGGSDIARFAATTGNLLLGSTTDLGYGLHAANKGTNGNLLVFDPTAATGTTKALFVAGQGQSGNLTEWRAYNATPGSGTLLGRIDQNGSAFLTAAIDITTSVWALQSNGLTQRAAGQIIWSSTSNYQGTADLSLSRASANTLQVGDGGANSNGTLKAAALQAVVANTGYPELVTMTNSSATNGSWKLQVPGSAAGSRNGSLEILDYNGSPRYTISVSGDQTWILPAGVQAASLSSTGTYTLYNQTATTGNTKEVIRAGAGQSTNLTEWQNNAGTANIAVTSDSLNLRFTGAANIRNGGTTLDFNDSTNSTTIMRMDPVNVTLGLASALEVRWPVSSSDAGIKRAGAGYVAVTNGSTGLGKIVVSQSTPSASTDAGTAGAIWADANYIYVQTAAGTIKRVALTTF